MKRKGKQTKNVNLLPFHIIKAASEGDIGVKCYNIVVTGVANEI